MADLASIHRLGGCRFSAALQNFSFLFLEFDPTEVMLGELCWRTPARLACHTNQPKRQHSRPISQQLSVNWINEVSGSKGLSLPQTVSRTHRLTFLVLELFGEPAIYSICMLRLLDFYDRNLTKLPLAKQRDLTSIATEKIYFPG